uniref:Putative portal protein n=1 Tax=viral metagenome TaxID=1070528 RepID=A0A6M3KD55_9ZZZZ
MLSVPEILALKEQLRADASARETKYDELENACGGKLEDRQRDGAYPVIPANTQPDHIASELDTDKDLIINRARSMVQATATYLGQVPTLYAPPVDGTDESMNAAEKLERICYGLWDFWCFPRRMSDIGVYCSELGTAVGAIWPDIGNKLPRLTVRSPRGFYPVPKDEDGYDLALAIFCTKYDGKQAAKMFNKPKLADEDDIEVVQYIDDKYVITIAGDERAEKNIKHDLGFCPVICIPNITIPGSPFGEATIANMTLLQKYMNYVHALLFSVAEEQMSQPLVLPNGAQWPKNLAHGPRDTIELPEGATGQAAYRIPPMTVPFDVFRIRDILGEEISMVSDVPQMMTGGKDYPYASGRSVTAQLGPTESQLSGRLEGTIYPAIRKLIRMAFLMMEKMWPDEQHTISGMQKMYRKNDKVPFSETFTIDELGGRYDVQLVLESGRYFDESADHIARIQDMQNQILSKETAMQYSPYIKPGTLAMEKERINREVEQNIQQSIVAQAAAQSAATQNAPMSEPGRMAYGLEQGYVGETEPAPIPGGMEVGQAEALPTEVDPLIQQAADLLRSIPNIKGQVYLMGDFLTPSDYGEGQSPTMTIGLTDMIDKQTIINFVQKQVPEMYGAMEFVKVTEPEPPFLDVSPGTNGYEIRGGVEAQTPEGQPPEGGEIPPEMMAALTEGGV